LAIYKTVLIIFPLNLHTITITLDVVKWRGGSFSVGERTGIRNWEANRIGSPEDIELKEEACIG